MAHVAVPELAVARAATSVLTKPVRLVSWLARGSSTEPLTCRAVDTAMSDGLLT